MLLGVKFQIHPRKPTLPQMLIRTQLVMVLAFQSLVKHMGILNHFTNFLLKISL